MKNEEVKVGREEEVGWEEVKERGRRGKRRRRRKCRRNGAGRQQATPPLADEKNPNWIC